MDKNYALVLGAGKSGISATKALINIKNCYVYLYDEDDKTDISKIKKILPDDSSYEIKISNISDEELNKIKICIISPGFPKFKEIVKKLRSNNIPIISEIELGYLINKGLICGITGSNGKTTVTSLVGEILKTRYNDVHVCGNIGVPFCEEAIYTNENSVSSIELSSFQLEDIKEFKPNVAAILNIAPDHLDRYDKYEDYINAKLNIAINQTKSDVLILNYDSNILRELSNKKNIFKSKIVYFSSKTKLSQGFYLDKNMICYTEGTKTINILDVNDLILKGIHNYENVMASIAISYFMNVPISNIIEVCKKFKPLPHRIEFVRNKSGINFYNDSKATNPDSAIKAINSIDGKIILIAGGKDKNFDYGDFVMKIKERVKELVLFGENRKKIASKCKVMNYNNVSYADNLDDAINISLTYANVGDNILLSPASSSFDMFKGYEDRGNQFKEKVMNLK